MLHARNHLVQFRCSLCRTLRDPFRSEAVCGQVLHAFSELNEAFAKVAGGIYWSHCCNRGGVVQAMGLSWPWDKYHLNILNFSWILLWA